MRKDSRPCISADAVTTWIETEKKTLHVRGANDALRLASGKTNNVRVRARACSLLGLLRAKEAIPVLLKIGQVEGNEELTWAALSALGLIGSHRATKPLIEVVRTAGEVRKKQAAAYALWLIGDNRARNTFIRIAEDSAEDDTTRGFAVEGLGSLKPTARTVTVLVRALQDSSVNVRFSALCALSGAASLAVNLKVRPEVRLLLTRRAIPAIRRRLQDKGKIKGEGTVAKLAGTILPNVVRLKSALRPPG
jgi:HEAT repeat protein